jgi:hypothetical protein
MSSWLLFALTTITKLTKVNVNFLKLECRWMLFFATCSLFTMASAQAPDCKQYGGTQTCTPVLDTYFYSGVGQWQYPNQPPPPPFLIYGKSAVEVTPRFAIEQSRLSREQAYWSNAKYGYSSFG